MPTRFFNHTKPNSVIIISLIILTHLLFCKIFIFNNLTNLPEIAETLGVFVFLILNLLILGFIKNKNDVTKHHNYTLFFFACTVGLFPEIYNFPSVIAANFFILLAFYQLMQIENSTTQKKIIFDTSLFIFCAGILYSWAFLYILLVFIIALSHTKQPFRNSLIPLVAFGSVSVLLFSGMFFAGYGHEFLSLFRLYIGFSWGKYSFVKFLLPVIFLVSVVLGVIFFYLLNPNKTKKGISLPVILYIAVTTIITIFSEEKSTSEIIFFLLPIALLLGTQFEKINKTWIKESWVYAFLIFPFVVFLLYKFNY